MFNGSSQASRCMTKLFEAKAKGPILASNVLHKVVHFVTNYNNVRHRDVTSAVLETTAVSDYISRRQRIALSVTTTDH